MPTAIDCVSPKPWVGEWQPAHALSSLRAVIGSNQSMRPRSASRGSRRRPSRASSVEPTSPVKPNLARYARTSASNPSATSAADDARGAAMRAGPVSSVQAPRAESAVVAIAARAFRAFARIDLTASDRIAGGAAAADDGGADRRDGQRAGVQELAVEVDLDVGRPALPEQVEVVDQVQDHREGAGFHDV